MAEFVVRRSLLLAALLAAWRELWWWVFRERNEPYAMEFDDVAWKIRQVERVRIPAGRLDIHPPMPWWMAMQCRTRRGVIERTLGR